MRIIDNTSLRSEAENKQNKMPTPLEVKNNLAKTAQLGEYFEEPNDQIVIPQSTEERMWLEKNAVAASTEKDEDVYKSDLENTVPADPQANAEIDELPEDLKDELGTPDEEVKE
jgi:hypothetical protein